MSDATAMVKREKQLTQRGDTNNHKSFELFSQLIKSKYDVKIKQIIDKLLLFLEAGIKNLYDECHKTGKTDFLQIYRDVKTLVDYERCEN